jgi:mono/diheme cytochrome c family protein
MRWTIVLVPLLLAVLAGAGPRPAPPEGPGDASATRADRPEQTQAAGARIFRTKGNCVSCHAADGTGTALGPDLTDGQWLNIDGTFDEIVALVRAGVPAPKRYPTPMPPMGGGRLSKRDIEAVARYVLELAAPVEGKAR